MALQDVALEAWEIPVAGHMSDAKMLLDARDAHVSDRPCRHRARPPSVAPSIIELRDCIQNNCHKMKSEAEKRTVIKDPKQFMICRYQ
jgi:hypothetical protein